MNRSRNSGEHQIKSSQQEILTSLEISGLDRATTLIIGGSALTFAGIRPAHDIDVMIPGAIFHDLDRSRRTPGGLLLRPKPGAHRPFLETVPTQEDVLAFDITHPHDDLHHRSSPELDKALLRQMAEFPQMQGFRYLPPEFVAAHKAELGRRKDRRDRRLISQHLR